MWPTCLVWRCERKSIVTDPHHFDLVRRNDLETPGSQPESRPGARRFLNRLAVFSHKTNIGDARAIALYPELQERP